MPVPVIFDFHEEHLGFAWVQMAGQNGDESHATIRKNYITPSKQIQDEVAVFLLAVVAKIGSYGR